MDSCLSFFGVYQNMLVYVTPLVLAEKLRSTLSLLSGGTNIFEMFLNILPDSTRPELYESSLNNE
jgi:hypothetical protein